MPFITILLFQFVSNIEKSRSLCGHVASPLSRICSGLDDSDPVVAPVWKSRGHPQTWINIRPCWQYADLPPTRNVAHCGAFRCSRHIWCIQKLTCFCYISGNCGYQRLPKIFQSSEGMSNWEVSSDGYRKGKKRFSTFTSSLLYRYSIIQQH